METKIDKISFLKKYSCKNWWHSSKKKLTLQNTLTILNDL